MIIERRYIILFVIAISTGCAIGPVAESDISQRKNVRRINHDTDPIHITSSTSGDSHSLTVENPNFSIDIKKPFRVKYDSFYFDFLNLIVVKSSTANGKSYPVWIDTGYNNAVLTNGLTIMENDLAIYPLGQDHNQEYFGLCYLPELHIGDMTIINPFCQYLQRHWELSVLGLPFWKQTGFIIGLNLLDSFSYLRFDNVHKELEFSLDQPFQPSSPHYWNSFSMVPEFDEKRGYRLMVHIPIGEQKEYVSFDTCGRYGLVLTEKAWNLISGQFQDASIREGKFPMGFSTWLPCQKATVPTLNIAGHIIKNAEFIIQKKDTRVVFDPYISMAFFRDTELVLDFKQNVMWIKN